MPIKPENKHRYPDNWKAIRQQILAECQGKCEFCGVENYSITAKGKKVILTIAHLDHIPEHNERENLKALCQKCHNNYDAQHRAKTRKESKMGIDTELNNAIFKHGLTGYHQTVKMASETPQRAFRVFELMDKDKKKDTETANGQFIRLWNIIKRRELTERKQVEDAEKMSQWKKEMDVAPRISPEKIKEMLDAQLDSGKISEAEHDWGYKGLEFLWGYIPEQETEVPF